MHLTEADLEPAMPALPEAILLLIALVCMASPDDVTNQ